jgi:hypothetical protein
MFMFGDRDSERIVWCGHSCPRTPSTNAPLIALFAISWFPPGSEQELTPPRKATGDPVLD